jgi:predicted nucleic acid-binding Zn ribbon protein
MGGGGGLIFKGTGFYLTDYVKKEGKKATSSIEKKSETKPSDPSTSTSTDAKPAAPSSSSPDTKKE